MTQTVLTVFDVDRPGTSGRREAPRGGGGHAEPALVGSRVGEYRHRVVGTSEKLGDAGGDGGWGGGGVIADAEESWEPICGDGLDSSVLALFFGK